ncbi:hypothetical protein Moror_9144 [Moniliophthora roreri MCA 2997]|uniref:DUF6534 domain-containing protein n=1 Tax=Moniliophthora roreri (strain MCA 2997) TaxID=1381753 RepID=V2XGF9_MONRO|nr:hypothetical protein Moror_9144 [Moniliophthora roreri MCA 2997]
MADAITGRAMKSLEEVTVDNTLGAVFLGVIGSGVLFGVTCLQAYIYYHRFSRDSVLHKISVAVLWILDTFHLSLTVHVVYHYLVKNFGNHAAYPKITWSLKLQVLVNVIIILIVQSLYAYRVWLLGGYHHGFLKYLVASVVAGGFVIGIILSYKVYGSDTFAGLENIAWAINASLATSTVIDFLMSSAMCYYLWKSKCHDSRLNSRISTVMQYTLCTGLITSACSLSALFTYTLMPNNLIFLALEFLLTKLYVGSFLAMLNARQPRQRIRKTQEETNDDSSSHNFRNLQFKIQTTVQTETHRGSYVPSQSSTMQSGDSTYTSLDEPMNKNWDIESQTLPLEEAVLRDREFRTVGQQKQKPEYMAQW